MHAMTPRERQEGAALIVSLLLLTVLTLIGLTSARTTRLETIMATNAKESAIAFEAAEAAVRDAEQFVENVVAVTAFDGNGGLFSEDDADPDYYDSSSWGASNSQAYSGTFPEVATQPRYIVKYVGTFTNEVVAKTAIGIGDYGNKKVEQEVSLFRITTRGTGRNDSSRVLIQTYYGKVF